MRGLLASGEGVGSTRRWGVDEVEGLEKGRWPLAGLRCHPLLPVPQASEHNVSHEAVAIKRMLELGLVKNLTYF